MGKAPDRSANVFFVGAGVPSAFGLPNTQELLALAHELAERRAYWGRTKRIGEELEAAYGYFYPVEAAEVGSGFRPNVTDFFSVLTMYEEVTSGLPDRGLERGAELLLDLRRAIAFVLRERLRDNDSILKKDHPYLEAMLQPGNLIVSSNWDVLLERYAFHHDIPLRFVVRRPEKEVTLLKLHGSIDWTAYASIPRRRGRLRWPIGDYAPLQQRVFGPRTYRIRPSRDEDPIWRVDIHDHWTEAWRRMKSRSLEPLMVTMSLGKSQQMTHLESVWRDAYSAISRARNLEVVGYSLPADDLEIRTLLIAGLRRGSEDATIVVRNPSPEVHERFRFFINRGIEADYQPVPPP